MISGHKNGQNELNNSIILNEHYVYLYLRIDGTPYYVGKGKGNRYKGSHTVSVPPLERIEFVAENLTDEQACKLEQELIEQYGRKDLGTGILRNLTSGGEGAVPGPLVRQKLSDIKKGKRPNNYGKTYTCKSGFENRSKAKAGRNHSYYGKQRSDEERQKISKTIKETWSRPLQTCPHCGKQGYQNMTRWHFDNCKENRPKE